eukprot:2365-Heterococcus_DN1.PRE.2
MTIVARANGLIHNKAAYIVELQQRAAEQARMVRHAFRPRWYHNDPSLSLWALGSYRPRVGPIAVESDCTRLLCYNLKPVRFFTATPNLPAILRTLQA